MCTPYGVCVCVFRAGAATQHQQDSAITSNSKRQYSLEGKRARGSDTVGGNVDETNRGRSCMGSG